METGEFVLPGDEVGTSEECESGPWTYENRGVIYSLATGYVHRDEQKHEVCVNPVTEIPPEPLVGEVVIGRVTDVKPSVVLVAMECMASNPERGISNSTQAAIHISNVKDSYVQDLSQEYAFMDIVKAHVIDLRTMRLSTEDAKMGVIKAVCQRCKKTLVLEDKTLKCPACNRIETRKLSEDYGTGDI